MTELEQYLGNLIRERGGYLSSHDQWLEEKANEVKKIVHQEIQDREVANVRERAAIAALHGLLVNPRKIGSVKEYAEAAINYTDALIEELKKKL